jgi:hypothetical protein
MTSHKSELAPFRRGKALKVRHHGSPSIFDHGVVAETAEIRYHGIKAGRRSAIRANHVIRSWHTL